MEIIKELELTKLIQRDKIEKVASKIFSDERLKEFWSYYDFLSNTAMNLSAKEDKHKIMYSTYYWYTKYKKRYFEVHGYEAGIEQEGTRLLEELENELEDGVVWRVIQEIEEDLVF
ncbi:hypothetical protein [Bacillus pseudomycoides]|uniref:hypothetical protein n=1 Tax=Bacillus pseudomycoides TaxID=64104 RepID=UPI000BF127DE|nr:hypothetical protein [Bacillus pseudomycoides]PEJ35493.1 hypothetical protein CN677_13430 [Bacillus pseudomycoides]PHA80580.1 hypothetical protein COE78_26435 [Bacillus pseudomycoides]PHC78583.1 hypothetical protein COF38_05015 [Bacillus pseudomycoides]